MDRTARRANPSSDINASFAAKRLADEVAAGRALPVLANPLLQGGAEAVHAELAADAWRHTPIDVVVSQRQVVTPGSSPLLHALASAATAIGNRRARAEAQRLAAPQWHPLGTLPILATTQRLLFLHEGEWASVWYAAIHTLVPQIGEQALGIVFEEDAPYLLIGEWVPYLSVVITTVLADHYGVEVVKRSMLSPGSDAGATLLRIHETPIQV